MEVKAKIILSSTALLLLLFHLTLKHWESRNNLGVPSLTIPEFSQSDNGEICALYILGLARFSELSSEKMFMDPELIAEITGAFERIDYSACEAGYYAAYPDETFFMNGEMAEEIKRRSLQQINKNWSAHRPSSFFAPYSYLYQSYNAWRNSGRGKGYFEFARCDFALIRNSIRTLSTTNLYFEKYLSLTPGESQIRVLERVSSCDMDELWSHHARTLPLGGWLFLTR